MSFLKKFLKTLFAILLVALLSGAGYYFYDQYEQEKKDRFELSFATEKDWVWHDKYGRIQYRSVTENKTVLRKVYLNRNYVIYAYKNDDYSLSSMVKFMTSCKPDKKIETSEVFSDGTPKVLKCNEKGDALHYQVKWSGKNSDFIWEENLGGFSLKENFTYWDFSKLDQEVTLSKAK